MFADQCDPFFQSLDLTVNGSAKKFVRNQFTEYYSSAVKEQLDSGKQLDDIDVDFRLSTVKPLHSEWLISMYNYFTTRKGAEIIVKGWKNLGFQVFLMEPPFCHLKTLFFLVILSMTVTKCLTLLYMLNYFGVL